MTVRKRRSPRRRVEFIEPLEGRLLLSRDIYVDINSPGPTRDGTSWEQAFVDLQDGLAAAVSGDRILVADGVYKPTSGTDRTISFVLKNGVGLCGGYAGWGAAEPDDRNPSAFPSILSGDLGQAGSIADNSYQVVSASNVSASAVLDGFIITSGNANGSSASNRNRGGGMYNSSSSPTVTNCTFSGNSASYGGAMYNSSSNPTLTNCILWSNAALIGPQIYQGDGTTTAAYCDIQDWFSNTGNIKSDPLFLRNPSPGADGVWGTADDDYGDLRLRPNSPCIDAGNNAAVPADTLDLDGDGNTAEPIPFDLAGAPRFWDYPGKADTGSGAAPIVDMGAYEMSSLLIAGTANPDQVYLRLDASGTTVQVWVNADPAGAPAYTAPLNMPSPMGIWTGGADDTINIDASNGNPIPPSGLLVDGGIGNDTLTLTGINSADNLIAHAGGLSLSDDGRVGRERATG